MSCSEEREVGDPTGEAEEALIPPRGKQVPRAEINGQNLYVKTTIYEKRAKKKKSAKRLVSFFVGDYVKQMQKNVEGKL